jgi:hypothetical protein
MSYFLLIPKYSLLIEFLMFVVIASKKLESI